MRKQSSTIVQSPAGIPGGELIAQSQASAEADAWLFGSGGKVKSLRRKTRYSPGTVSKRS